MDDVYFVKAAFSLPGQIHAGFHRLSTHDGFIYADNTIGPGYRHLQANLLDQSLYGVGNEIEWISEERCFNFVTDTHLFAQESTDCVRKAVCKGNLGFASSNHLAQPCRLNIPMNRFSDHVGDKTYG